MASWLVCSTPEQVVQVWSLAGDIVLCPWARHFTLTVPLCGGLASHPGGSRILQVALCYRNQDKLWPNGPLGLSADFTLNSFSVSERLQIPRKYIYTCNTHWLQEDKRRKQIILLWHLQQVMT